MHIDTTGNMHPHVGCPRSHIQPKSENRTELDQRSRHPIFIVRWSSAVLMAAVMILLVSSRTQAATAPGASGAHGPYPVGAPLTDSAITMAVENELLRDDNVFPNTIDVTSKMGIVTLAGTANNLLNRERVASIAECIRGVRGVIDLVTVTPVSRPDEDIRKDIVNALLDDPATESYQLQATVSNAVVILTGSVATYPEKKLVERIAKSVNGVVEIHNNISIAYLGKRTSAEMTGDITDRIQWDIWLNGDLINVSVMNGTARLTGTVGSVRETWRAFEDAWVDGIVAVDVSGLKVDATERDANRRKMAFAVKTNDEIKQAISATFHQDPRLKGFSPDVVVDDGEIFLRGTVGNIKAKISAEQDARNTVGVESVECLIKVRSKERLSDSAMAAQLKSALFADPVLGDYSLTVAVINHVAYLSGTVDSRFQMAEAMDVATRTKGVTMIINHIKIQREFSSFNADRLAIDPFPYTISEIYNATPHRNDDRLRVDIENALSWCPDVGWGDVKVTVNNGFATLSGSLLTWIGRTEADRAAQQCIETTVVNHIDVKKGAWWWP